MREVKNVVRIGNKRSSNSISLSFLLDCLIVLDWPMRPRQFSTGKTKFCPRTKGLGCIQFSPVIQGSVQYFEFKFEFEFKF